MRPIFVVLHYTAMRNAGVALDRLCDPKAEVSAHYLIGKDGTVWQMVEEQMRAWHAGAGSWQGLTDINSRSIGIELDNRGDHPFSEPQKLALETLLRGILDRWQIPPKGVIGHSDLAPGRKWDPGPRFDWARLTRQGLAGPAGQGAGDTDCTPRTFRALARQHGYTADVPDDILLAAVRLRYRPWGAGPLSPEDVEPLVGHRAPS